MSPLVSVQRSTAVPSGVVPNGSTVVLAPAPWWPCPPSSVVAAAGEAAPPASRPTPSAATSDVRRPRARGLLAGAVGRRGLGRAGMGTPMSEAVHRRRRPVAGAPPAPDPGTAYGACPHVLSKNAL